MDNSVFTNSNFHRDFFSYSWEEFEVRCVVLSQKFLYKNSIRKSKSLRLNMHFENFETIREKNITTSIRFTLIRHQIWILSDLHSILWNIPQRWISPSIEKEISPKKRNGIIASKNAFPKKKEKRKGLVKLRNQNGKLVDRAKIILQGDTLPSHTLVWTLVCNRIDIFPHGNSAKYF